MLVMEYNIKIGKYRLLCLDSVNVKKSVTTLSDTATIILPASYINKAINVENKIKEGDEVNIDFGYKNNIKNEFKGYLKSIQTDDGTIKLECEDSIYLFRKEIPNKEMKEVSVKELLTYVISQIDASYTLSCDYDFKYDKFVINNMNAWDVLKKIQDETKANIYFKDKVLHVHPQYSEISNKDIVRFDFARNIEKSELKWKKEDDRKYFIEIEGVGKDGKRIVATAGKQGGEKRSVKVYGVTDINSLKKRGEEELKQIVYTGFEGKFIAWLIPYCEPTYKISLRDGDYPEKNGDYYVLSTDTTFSSNGGVREINIGKKI
jgi:hypothetical protein